MVLLCGSEDPTAGHRTSPEGRVPMGPRHRSLLLATVLLASAALAVPAAAATAPADRLHQDPVLVTDALADAWGSTVGPDGALYVTEPSTGTVHRVDPRTGETTTFASGLPSTVVDIGGAVDVAFHGGTAYVLVTLVGADVGGDDVVGIYRVDSPTSFTVVADLGAFGLANPPDTDFFVPTGVHYAIERYQNGFLVSDGHHNRVLHVTLDGEIDEVLTLGNDVPTGMETAGRHVLLALAGPVPHLPDDGRLVAFDPRHGVEYELVSGARLMVDVERRGWSVYVLSQGFFTPGNPEGSPADPDTGVLYRVTHHGLRTVADGLDRPTSMELIGRTAYVVSIDGEIWRVSLGQ
jgi:sugar lactone lactonase YvrE